MLKKEEVMDLIKDQNIGMMTNIDEDGKLVSHPMTREGDLKDDLLWFFTSRDSEKVTELKKNNAVNVAFHDGDSISISGHVELVDNLEKKKELWSKELEVFFEGPEDEQIILLKVDIDSIEYWTADNKMKSAFEFVKGMVSDEEADLGEHDAIDL